MRKMNAEPCTAPGCVLPGGWILYRIETFRNLYLFTAKELYPPYAQTGWRTLPTDVSQEAFAIVRSRGESPPPVVWDAPAQPEAPREPYEQLPLL